MKSSIDPIFDLEQDIMSCWQVVDDVKLLYYHFGDDPRFVGLDAKAEDEMMNLLLGVKSMYELKFEKLWKTFEVVCKNYHIARNERESFDD